MSSPARWPATICAGARLPGSRSPRRREPSTKSALPLLDGRQHRRDHLGPVAAVAVDEEDDGALRGDSAAMPVIRARP